MKTLRNIIKKLIKEILDTDKILTKNEKIKKTKTTDEEMLLEISNFWKYDGFFSTFTESELKKILEFIEAVNYRTNSGTGEGVHGAYLRDKFMNCPESFRQKFSTPPSSKLWRGDQGTPCMDVNHPRYDQEYDNYFRSLQSFAGSFNGAKFFGHFIFPGSTIKSYSGSFDLKKFNKISRADSLFLSSLNFLNENPEYLEQFDYLEFYPFYYAMCGYGTIGRKYRNKLSKLLINKLGLKNYWYASDYLVQVGDDEGEIMFFNVEYDCKKIDKLHKIEHW